MHRSPVKIISLNVPLILIDAYPNSSKMDLLVYAFSEIYTYCFTIELRQDYNQNFFKAPDGYINNVPLHKFIYKYVFRK